MKRFAFIFLLFTPVIAADQAWPQTFGLEGGTVIPLDRWEIRTGDQPAPGENGAGNSSWRVLFPEPRPVEDPALTEGIFWLRARVVLQGKKVNPDPLALFFIKLPSAYEVFWDGQPAGQNGRTGIDRATETPGKIRVFLPLEADRTAPGEHLLTIRVSNFHIRQNRHDFGVLLGYHSVLRSQAGQKKEESLLHLGLFLTATLFCFFIIRGGWRYPPAVCFCGYTILLLSSNLWAYLLRSDTVTVLLFYRLDPLVFAGNLISFLPLSIFILWHLEIPWRKSLAGCAGSLALLKLIAFFLFQHDLWQMDLFCALVMTGLIVRQFRHGKTGSGAALAGYSFFLLDWLSFALLPVLPGLAFIETPFAALVPNSVFLVGMMSSITLKMREQFRALDALRFRSQRLEAELLKKCIQPHFIMNTLLSIKSYLGSDTHKAEKQIEALAEEFRLINRISAELKIPLEEELHLCRLHLELMGYRRDAEYRLVTEGDCQNLFIPPLVLHTLIENGLTHAFKPLENGSFRLICRKTGQQNIFRLENGGSNLPALLRNTGEKIEEGLGLKYVRARLEEACPGNWDLEYGLAGGIWFVQIVTGEKS